MFISFHKRRELHKKVLFLKQQQSPRNKMPFIKSTGKANKAKLLMRKKKDSNLYYIVDENTSMVERDSESSIATSTVAEPEVNPIQFCSYNLLLLSRQKQVGYIKSRISPLRSMSVFSFDSYPVFLDSGKCLVRVEVS